MPHGTFILGPKFALENQSFLAAEEDRGQIDDLIDEAANILGVPVKQVELFVSPARPLSRFPLDIEFKVETDQVLTDDEAKAKAKKLFDLIHDDFSTDASPLYIGVWLRSPGASYFYSNLPDED